MLLLVVVKIALQEVCIEFVFFIWRFALNSCSLFGVEGGLTVPTSEWHCDPMQIRMNVVIMAL